jgi:hypothetical protein
MCGSSGCQQSGEMLHIGLWLQGNEAVRIVTKHRLPYALPKSVMEAIAVQFDADLRTTVQKFGVGGGKVVYVPVGVLRIPLFNGLHNLSQTLSAVKVRVGVQEVSKDGVQDLEA